MIAINKAFSTLSLGAQHREPVDVTCECPQNGVGIQVTVAISVITNLNLPAGRSSSRSDASPLTR
jgi:hypothetical protein